MNPKLLRKLHRWVGLTCALTVMAAASSGILHVVMTWTQSPPPLGVAAPRLETSAVRVSPGEAVERIGGAKVNIRSLSLRMIGGEPWYQMLVEGTTTPFYINATDGREDERVDERYATEIAARHIGGASSVRWTRRLDAFDSEYIAIFRLLPVHRVDVDDGRGTRVYVSTVTGGVARATNDRSQFEANLFSRVHKYAFITSKPWRDGLLVAFTGLAFLASLAGVVLFFVTGRVGRGRPVS